MAHLFSVIMPVYNVQDYLKEAIDSVLSQTCEDFELIIVNDGSTDDSKLIAENYAESDNRIKLINKQNGGLSSARNAGLANATGTYIYFIDSDDSITRNMLENISEVFMQHDVDMVAFTAFPFFDNISEQENENLLKGSITFYGRDYLDEKKYNAINYYEVTTQHNNFVASACMYVVKKELYSRADLRFYPGIIHEDELFTRQMIFNCKDMFFKKRPLYNRRIRSNSISTSSADLNKAISFIHIGEELEKFNRKYLNNFLQKDIQFFFNKTLDILEAHPEKTSIYKNVLKQTLQSPLLKKYPISFRKLLELKYKKLTILKRKFSTLRYELGLRTRIRRMVNNIKKHSINAR